jgi:DNA-binding XRE family transcriptional regulator
MSNHAQAEVVYAMARLLLLDGATARISWAEMTPDGLAIRFEGARSAVIRLRDLRIPGSEEPIKLIDYSPVAAAFRTARGDPLQLGADVLYGLTLPGGRAVLEDHWRSNEFVVDRAVRRLRKAINMSIATLAQTTGLSAAKVAGIEAGDHVSQWDLLLLGAALDAHLPDIFFIQMGLGGSLKHRCRPATGPKVPD